MEEEHGETIPKREEGAIKHSASEQNKPGTFQPGGGDVQLKHSETKALKSH